MKKSNNYQKALSLMLDVDMETLKIIDEHTFSTEDGAEYWVLTHGQAITHYEANVLESLWAFNAEFLVKYTDIINPTKSVTDAIKAMQEKLCEDANPIILALVSKKLDQLMVDALAADGLGHFLSPYDGKMLTHRGALTFHAFRTN